MKNTPLDIQSKNGFICDMDGVIYHGNKLLPGVREFVDFLQNNDKRFLFLTNSSERAPLELRQKLERMGLDVTEDHFYTSALATAHFLAKQKPNCTAYVIGEPGLMNALYTAGITMNDVNPDYVVIGDTRNYNYESIKRAVHFVFGGAKLIGTNPDISMPSEHGIISACGSLLAPIEMTTGQKAYFLGKPNPLMMRTAIKLLGVSPDDAVIVGDRMDTDIIAGVESDIESVLVLSGCTAIADLVQFPYRPDYIYNDVGDLVAGKLADISESVTK